MSRYDKDQQGERSIERNTMQETGEDEMTVIEKGLKDMQKPQSNVNRAKLRKALIKETIKENNEALKRLSRT